MMSAKAFAATLPPNFIETTVGNGWQEVVGVTWDEANRMYVWDRPGRVWIVENGVKPATPMIDISEEVSAWNDLGCLGFALDPKFRLNGYIYLFYVVDHHHLEFFGTPQYNPAANDYFRATIGRLTRYTAIASNDFRTVDKASRKILIGETISTGVPVTYNTHSVGSLIFSPDGTLLASTGDGGALSDQGSDPMSYYQQSLNEGIIRPKENIGAFRSQLVDSLNGKILRINPANGDGVPSNPFYDSANPRAPRSRVYALGFRNPFRMALKPGTGSHVEADCNPGVLFVGDVGYQTWEEITLITGPAQNAGWPVFEGFTQFPPGYETFNPVNPDAPNPLFGSGGCTQPNFRFRDLIKEATLGTPSWPNPCNTAVQVPNSVPHFVHTRPVVDWRHGSGPSRCGYFSGNTAAIANLGAAGAPISGPQFGGSSAIGGTWYTGTQFPPQYRNAYFFADFGSDWIRVLMFDSNNVPIAVTNFATGMDGVVHMAVHPVTGELYAGSVFTGLFKYTYGGNASPRAVASSDVTYGPAPLTVQFTGSGSSDPEGLPLSYRWDFGDGTPISTQANPSHVFNAPAGVPTRYNVTLTVTDSASNSNTATLVITPNNTPPSVSIISPVNGSFYPITSETIYPLSASILDSEHPLNQLSVQWQTILYHNTHNHPSPPDTNLTTTTVISPLGCEADTYWYRIVLTVTDPVGLSTTRESLLYPDCSTNNIPTVSDVSDQVINAGQSTGALPFTISDAETPANLLSVSGASSNPVLVPSGNISFGGTGANRTVTVTSASGQTGSATIFVTVGDGTNNVTETFLLTVFPANNTAPTISAIADQTFDEDTSSGPLSFTIGDAQTPGALTLTRNSSNPALVPTNNIVFGGSGANRTVTVTPATNQSGSATITVGVSDGQYTTPESFSVIVNAVNDPPSLNAITDVTVSTNSGPQTVTLAGIGAGPSEGSQTLSITAVSSNPSVIPNPTVNYTSPNPSGALTFAPALNASGTAIITVTVDDGQAQNNTVSRSFTVTVVEGPPLIFIEAEAGVVSAPMVRAASANALGGQYIYTPTSGQGTASYQVNLPQTGTYVVWARVIGSNDLSDSFLVSVDGGNEAIYDVTPGGPSPNWQWTLVNGRTVGDPRLFTLSAGSHTFLFTGREPATRLDALYITTDRQFVPPTNSPNASPTISNIPDQSTPAATATAPIPFTIADADTPVTSLTLNRSSSNQTLVPTNNIVFGGSGANRTVTVTPAAGQSGAATITVTVSDGTSNASDTFVLTVLPANNTSPTISGIADQTLNEDTGTGPLSFTIGDAETPGSLTLSRASSNPALVPTNNIVFGGSGANRTVTVTPAANQYGSATITISVSDGQFAPSTSFLVTVNPVNDPPTLDPIGDVTVSTNAGPQTIPLNGIGPGPLDGDQLTVTATSSNPGVIPDPTINYTSPSASGVLIFTPAADITGSAVITVTVNDGQAANNTVSRSFTITVGGPPLLYLEAESGVITAPMVIAPSPTARNGQYVYTLSGGLGSASFSVNIPQTGTYVIWSRVIGSNDLTDSFFVSVDGANEAIYDVTPSGSSSDWQWTLVNGRGLPNPRLFTLSQGNHTILFRGREAVTRLDALYITTDLQFVPTDTPNTPPSISNIADQSTAMGVATPAIPFTIGDAETAPANLTLSRSSSNQTLVPTNNIVFGGSGANRTVTVTPASGQSGTAVITVTVSDGIATASDTFVLAVNPANNTPPTISSIADQTVNEDTSTGPINFTIGDAESAPGSLILTPISSNPAMVPTNNIAFGGSGASRTVTITPATNQSGTATITVSVSDGQFSTNASFLVTINPVDDAPTVSNIADQTISVGGSTDPLAFTIGDVDTALENLSLVAMSSDTTLVPASNIALAGSGANRTVTVSAAPESGTGTATITITASDGTSSSSETFIVTVSAVITRSLTNPTTITIAPVGAAAPYPSVINVSGLGGTVSQVSVGLNAFDQTWPADVDVLLVGPAGQKVMLMSDAGGGTPVTGLNFTLSDGAPAAFPLTALTSGTFTPTDYETGDTFPAPAPVGPYGTALSVFNGLSGNGAWSLYVADDGAGDQGSFANGWTLTITTIGAVQQTPVITWSDPSAITYGTPLGGSQLNATANVPGTFVYSPAAGTVLNAGNSQPLSATFTPADPVSYTTASKTVSINVLAAPLTIRAADKSKAYGAANPPLTVSYSGFVNADGPGNLATPATLATTAAAGSPVGTYPITVSGATSANYNITQVNGTLTVTQALLTIRADDKARPIGQTNPPLTATYTGFVNGDTPATLTTPVSLATTATVSSPPGAYPITASGAFSPDYSITHVDGTLTINPQNPPTVAFLISTLNYAEGDGALVLDPLATVMDADSPDFDGGSLTVDFALNGASEDRLGVRNQGTGPEQISVEGNEISYGGLVIATFSGGSDGATPLVASLNGNATPAAVQALLANVTYENVSTTPSILSRTVRVIVNDGDGGSSIPRTLTLSVAGVPEAPLITWSNPSPVTYGTALGGIQLNATANVVGTFAYNPAAGTVLNAGNSQPLSVTFTPSDTVNYTTTTKAVAIDVLPAALIITAADQSRVYGAANPPLTVSYSGFVNADGPGNLASPATATTTATAGSPVGIYPIAVSGATSPNYNITEVNGTLTVTQALLTIRADDKARLIGETNPSLTATYTGFVNGDTPAALTTPVSLGTTATVDSPPGTYPITASGASSPDYSITHVDGTLTINPQNPPIVALLISTLGYSEGNGAVVLDPWATVMDPDSPDFDGGSLTVDFTLNGASEDRLGVNNQGTGPGEIGVEGNEVSYGGLLIATFSGGTDGATPWVASLNGNATLAAVQALLANVTYENVSTTPSTLSRTVRVVVSDGDGGSSIPQTLTISVAGVPEAPIITWSNPSPVTYATALGGIQLNATANVQGTFAYSPAAGTVLNAGNGQPLSVTFTPADTVNYTTATKVVPIDVLPAPLTITAVDKSRLYGAANPALTAVYSGFVNGDSAANLTTPASLSTTAALGSSVGTYPITVGGGTAANYSITHVNGTLTVDPVALTIKADNKTRAAGQTNPPLTATYTGFVNGDTPASLTTPVVLGTTATVSSPIGAYPITASGATAVNYTITHVAGTLTVISAEPPAGMFTFTNPAAITIPHVGAATPYPSVINVSNVGGTVTAVILNLNGFFQTWPDDVDVMLVGPGGRKVKVMSDVGGGTPVTGVNLTLSDSALASLPQSGALTSGTFKPTDFQANDNFPAPAPAGAFATTLAAFNGFSANGAWSLYAVDDGAGDAGGFAGGWSLTVTTLSTNSPNNTPPSISGIPNQAVNEDTSTGLLSYTIGDAETPPANLILSRGSSNPVLVPTNNIVLGGTGSARTVSVIPAANQHGSATITVSVSDGQFTVSTDFVVTVTPVNDPPTISNIADQTTGIGTAVGPIAFTIGDVETPAGSLNLGAESTNSTLVPPGNISFGGSGSNRTVSVIPIAGQTGTTIITVTVGDGTNSVSDVFLVTVTSFVTGTQSFTNATAIVIPHVGAATPYPSIINVGGLAGTIDQVTVGLDGFYQTFPADIDVLLVGPLGQKVMLMSDAGGGIGVTGVNLTLSDTAAAAVPSDALASGTFRPADYEAGETLPAPAPAGPYGTVLSTFNGLSANGAWSLYAADDGAGDEGGLAGGWSLTITTSSQALPTGSSNIPPPTISIAALDGGGGMLLTIKGSAGKQHTIEVSEDLITWAPLTTVQSTNETISVEDPVATKRLQRFYRVVTEP